METSIDTVVRQIFQSMSTQKIEYVVCRRPECINRLAPGDDVDIVVPKEAISAAVDIVGQCAEGTHTACVFRSRGGGVQQIAVAIRDGKRHAAVIRFDFQTALRHKGAVLIPGRTLLEGRRPHGTVWRPAAHVEGVGLLLHDVITKRAFRDGDFRRIAELREEKRESFQALLSEIAGAGMTSRIESLLQRRDASALMAIRYQLVARIVVRQFYKCVWWTLSRYLARGFFLFKRRGVLMTVVGPDGSGKTTLLREVSRQLDRTGLKVRTAYFGTPSPMLPTKWILRKLRHRKDTGQPNRDVRMDVTGLRNKLTYFAGSVHTLLDLYLRYLVNVRVYLSRAHVVLCDRYFYDLLVNPAPDGVRELFGALLMRSAPRPDLCLLLGDTAENIYERKPELAIQEIERQQNIYASLIDKPVEAQVITLDMDLERMASDATWMILGAYGARNA